MASPLGTATQLLIDSLIIMLLPRLIFFFLISNKKLAIKPLQASLTPIEKSVVHPGPSIPDDPILTQPMFVLVKGPVQMGFNRPT